MSIGIIFWVIMIVWLVFGFWRNSANIGAWVPGALIEFILFALLGWAVFGPAIHR